MAEPYQIEIQRWAIGQYVIAAVREESIGRVNRGDFIEKVIRQRRMYWTGTQWVSAADVSRAQSFPTEQDASEALEKRRQEIDSALATLPK